MVSSDAQTPAGQQRRLESFGYAQELNRSVSTFDLLVYGLVFMVPIAPWAIFGTVYNSASGMVPLVYVIGLVAMIFTALAYAQMAKSFPLAGSVFSYVGRGIHPSVGFFAGWAILLDYLLVPTLLYVFAAESMIGLFPGTPRWLWAIVFVVVNTIINLAGIGSLKIANRVFLAIELVFVVIFVVIAVRAINGESLPNVGWSTAADLELERGDRAADRRRAVDRGAEFPWLRRHLDARRGVDRQEEPGGPGDDHRAVRGRLPVRHPDLAGQPARRRPRVVQRRRGRATRSSPWCRRRRAPVG